MMHKASKEISISMCKDTAREKTQTLYLFSFLENTGHILNIPLYTVFFIPKISEVYRRKAKATKH